MDGRSRMSDSVQERQQAEYRCRTRGCLCVEKAFPHMLNERSSTVRKHSQQQQNVAKNNVLTFECLMTCAKVLSVLYSLGETRYS